MTWSRVKPRSATHGAAHDKARKQWAALHDPSDPCVRCGHVLGPMRSGLHLDHDDWDKTHYLGFSHGDPCGECGVRCNLSSASKVGNAIQRARRMGYTAPPRPSRDW